MMYYIMYNNQQMGPMPKEQLRNYGLNPQSMIWAEGMPNWAAAFTVPEIAEMLNGGTQQFNGGQPYTGPQSAGGQAYTGQPIETNLSLAIISTVCGFLFSCIGAIFGIIAIVKANNVKKYEYQGMYDAAFQASKDAKTNSYWAFGFAALGLVVNIIMFIVK